MSPLPGLGNTNSPRAVLYLAPPLCINGIPKTGRDSDPWSPVRPRVRQLGPRVLLLT